MLVVLHHSSKAQKNEFLKHFSPDAIKSICKCFINVINIKVRDQEKRKINRNRDKIRELVIPRISQKKRKEILVQGRGAFLTPLLMLNKLRRANNEKKKAPVDKVKE